MGSDNVGY